METHQVKISQLHSEDDRTKQSSSLGHRVEKDDKPLNSIGIPRQVGIAAGVAVAMTAGTISQVVNRAPEYEGTFQLTVQPETSREEAAVSPQIEDVNQPITDTHIRILESPHLLDPLVERLKADNPELELHDFTKNLKIRKTGAQQLEIRYRDTDPERIKLVLEQLSQTYVEYSQECRDSTCQGLQFVESQVPQIQQRVNDLRQEIQAFHQEHGLKNLEGQVRLFSTRSAEISKQSAEIQGKLAEGRKQYNELQNRMALQPDEAIAQGLLDRDARYQELLKQFQALDQQILTAMSSYRAEDDRLQALRTQHKAIVEQLNQEAGQVLVRYANNPNADLRDPVFQDPDLLNLLQQSIGTAHYIQVLEMRQQTIAQSQQAINQRKQELAAVLRRYSELRQELQAETRILQQYIDRQNVFQAQSEQQPVAWQVTQPPQLVADESGEPVPDYFHSLKKDVGSAAILGTLLGIAIAIVLQEKQNPRSVSLLGATPLGKGRKPEYPYWKDVEARQTVSSHSP